MCFFALCIHFLVWEMLFELATLVVILHFLCLILVLMECSLTCYYPSRWHKGDVLILVLMECSLTIKLNSNNSTNNCLNPCSNGMLSDNLKESVLDIFLFFSLSFNPFSVRELIPSEKFFANVCEFILHSK